MVGANPGLLSASESYLMGRARADMDEEVAEKAFRQADGEVEED